MLATMDINIVPGTKLAATQQFAHVNDILELPGVDKCSMPGEGVVVFCAASFSLV